MAESDGHAKLGSKELLEGVGGTLVNLTELLSGLIEALLVIGPGGVTKTTDLVEILNPST